VAKLPGVQSPNFGPGVGRPIIRGLDGARVQVLSDGLGSGDVSTVSVDHAVTIEPFLANQIEVLKGPATLLYGSGAIGGAVNVVDGRIPEALPDAPLEGRAELRGGSVNDERTGMVRLDGYAGQFAFHFDALPGEFVERLTVALESRIHRRNLGLRPAEPGQHPLDAGRVEGGNRQLFDDVAFGVTRIGTRAELHREFVTLGARFDFGDHLGGFIEAQRQHAGGHRIERTEMAGAFRAERLADALQCAVRRQAFRLVEQKDAVRHARAWV
jgi:iron complex outermembrane receptor protein